MLRNLEKINGVEMEKLVAQGGALTASEIMQQPHVWLKITALIEQQRDDLSTFLSPLLERDNLRIILTGAGTSAFIGECLAPDLLKITNRRVEAIPTTDLVSGPELYFQADISTLMISFGRSGSSPESVASINFANQIVKEIYHLVITCNEKGQLYQHAKVNANAFPILLPDETHDRGFAMTTSFTSMLLATTAVFNAIKFQKTMVEAISSAALDILSNNLPDINALVERQFKRVVYLGSNGLKGLAREAALKLLELSDGAVVAMFDSPLGFRHGPKTIVNKETLVVIFMSNDAQARQYELDLLNELRSDNCAGKIIALSAQADLNSTEDCVILKDLANATDLALALPYIVFAQTFAFLQSLALGLRPDTPSVSGTVNRVVSGVTIYPLAISSKE